VKKNYPLLLAGQSLSAFGDNAILAVILGQLIFLKQAGQITAEQLGSANAIYTSILFIPYVVLAPLNGYLNDRFPKTHWLMGGNFIKIVGTALAALSLCFGQWWQGVGYFIVGFGACVYSPAKYGILPEILPQERLVKANGMVELLTLVSILLGTIGGAMMIDNLPVGVCYALVGCFYAAALAFNAGMTRSVCSPEVKLSRSIGEFMSNFGSLLTGVRLRKILLGTTVFWACGAVMKMNFQPWGIEVLHLKDNFHIALLGLWLSLGVMIGSVLAGRWHRVGELQQTRRYGWTLAFIVALLAALESAPLPAGFIFYVAVAILVFAGVFAGLFLIPLNAALQSESNPAKLGKTIAAQNFVENTVMLVCGGLVWLGVQCGLHASGVFCALAITVALVVTFLKMPPKATEVT
jgi:MFS transporter, LPLT family, lysophospholipid transporter